MPNLTPQEIELRKANLKEFGQWGYNRGYAAGYNMGFVEGQLKQADKALEMIKRTGKEK